MAEIEMIAVDSSNVDSIGFDPDTSTLRVRFHNGGVYEYDGVPEETFSEFMAASSLGKFLHQYIKGIYPFRKIS